MLKESPRKRARHTRARTPALLKGLIFGPTGAAMTPTHTRKRGRLYRYYVSTSVIKAAASACPIRRIPAAEIEAAVVAQVCRLVQTPEVIVATWRAAKQNMKGLTEREVREHLYRFDEIWTELFPAEQSRIIQLLVQRVQISEAGADITLRTAGLATLIEDLRIVSERSKDAA